jgi:hypothetical protein
MFVHLHLKYPLFLSNFNRMSNFLERLSNSSFLKIVEWELSCSMWKDTEGRTEITKLTVAFRYFANAPKNLDIEKYLIAWHITCANTNYRHPGI